MKEITLLTAHFHCLLVVGAWPMSATPVEGVGQALHNKPTMGTIQVQALMEALLIPAARNQWTS